MAYKQSAKSKNKLKKDAAKSVRRAEGFDGRKVKRALNRVFKGKKANFKSGKK